MKTTIAIVTTFSLAFSAFAEPASTPPEQKIVPQTEITGKPYQIGTSYVIAFSPVIPMTSIELPEGSSTVIAESGQWVKIRFSNFKNERSKDDPGKVVKNEKTYTAWVNSDSIVAFIEIPESKTAEGAAGNP